MEDNIKRIDIKEFREFGYLQELNRRFLHPLGLALEVTVDKDGVEKLGGIWDYRDDEEGILYGINESGPERKDKFLNKMINVGNEMEIRCKKRKEILGFDIEPI